MEVLVLIGPEYRPLYAGGHPAVRGPAQGNFVVTKEKLGIARRKGFKSEPSWIAACALESIERIEIAGGQVGKSKFGPVILFGLAGLAAKGSKDRTDMLVHLNDGHLAYFTIDAPVQLVTAHLLPTLHQLGVPVEG